MLARLTSVKCPMGESWPGGTQDGPRTPPHDTHKGCDYISNGQYPTVPPRSIPWIFTTIVCTCFLLILLTSCASSSPPGLVPTRTAVSSPTGGVASPAASPSSGADTTPTHYTSRVVLQGVGRPDDLVFDQQGRLLFSDFYNGTISRVNTDGSVTVLLRGVAGPEGMVVLQDGTMIIAEQHTNRILSLPPGAHSPTVLRTLPGTPSAAPCKDGVDGIAFDPTTNTIIVPDSPTGEVYRMSPDGKTLTLLVSGIVRPVGAVVDAQGNIYVADECGGTIWRITPAGKTTRMGGFGMPDDVAIDKHGNLLVIDLKPSIHALIRVRLSTGKHETLASKGFIEPQGLVVDGNDDIFVSDDYANIIMEYKPA
jgi:sugar lactone lactonase YvrE